ncbi:Adenine nucleotide alpha hydrolases-like protein [Dioscorea alata]|uniref:Adenine nucleotide alpha hydrolases-like protein n=1 Tax=Dioscorea alata TaxID=55571 RepID=A0ACB7U1I2_DIOAL|nr:Adenine nucleotide alpha hydrolases-like protein [Dioscorea alata]
MGKIPNFSFTVFPLRSVVVLEAISQIGLIYFIFTIGVEIEPSVVKRSGVRSVAFASMCMFVPFAIGSTSALMLSDGLDSDINLGAFVIFLGVLFSITAFSVLARILAELKLLSSDMGGLAISSVLIVDTCSWALFSMALTLQLSGGDMAAAFWVLLSGGVFITATFAIVKPAVWWVMQHTPEGQDMSEMHTCFLLAGVMAWGFTANVLGVHPFFGAFAYGLAIPSGTIGEGLIDKAADFMECLLLPLYFAIIGLRTNFASIVDSGNALFIVIVVLIASASKVAGSLFIAFFFKMPLIDGLSFGLLMNTKGIIELAILNIGRDKHIIGDQMFTVLLLMFVILTALVEPTLAVVMRTTRQFVTHKRRTIQWSKLDTELRLLVCVHSTREAPSMISLLEISSPMKRSPIFVYVLHLIELTGRATSMLLLTSKVDAGHHSGKDSSMYSQGNHSRLQTQSEQIMNAFESYEQQAGGVSVQPLTALSPYSTMHEDVCRIAEEKRVNLIILPFHKHPTVDGDVEVTHPALRSLNQHVLSQASCTVGILIDRGLSGRSGASCSVALLFFGGADDREALSYAFRLAYNKSLRLTVLRFIEGPKEQSSESLNDERVVTVMAEDFKELELDEAHLNEFRRKCEGLEGVQFSEMVSEAAEDIVAIIRSMEETHDLYIVGVRHSRGAHMITGLTDWSECPELGPIGDFLASSDFTFKVSALVVQQCSEELAGADAAAAASPDSPGRQVRLCMNN